MVADELVVMHHFERSLQNIENPIFVRILFKSSKVHSSLQEVFFAENGHLFPH